MAEKVKRMRCGQVRDRVAELLTGELDPAMAVQMEAHLRECEACHTERDELGHLLAGARAVGAADPPIGFMEQLPDRVWEAVHGPSAPAGVERRADVVPIPRRESGFGSVAVTAVLVAAAAVFVLWIAVGAGLLTPDRDPPLGEEVSWTPAPATPAPAPSETAAVELVPERVPGLADLGDGLGEVGFGPEPGEGALLGLEELPAEAAERFADSLDEEMAETFDLEVGIPLPVPDAAELNELLDELSADELRALEEALNEVEFDDLV